MTWYNVSKLARRLAGENAVNSPVDMEICGIFSHVVHRVFKDNSWLVGDF